MNRTSSSFFSTLFPHTAYLIISFAFQWPYTHSLRCLYNPFSFSYIYCFYTQLTMSRQIQKIVDQRAETLLSETCSFIVGVFFYIYQSISFTDKKAETFNNGLVKCHMYQWNKRKLRREHNLHTMSKEMLSGKL